MNPSGIQSPLTIWDWSWEQIGQKIEPMWGRSPELVVLGGDLQLRGHAFESRYRMLDIAYCSHSFVAKNVFLFKNTENSEMK